MFEEEGVPTTLFHGGFGLLTHRQVKKPTYHLYAFMARLGDQVLARGPDHLVTRRRHRPGHRAGLGAGGRHRPRPGRPAAHLRLSVPVGPPGTRRLPAPLVGQRGGRQRLGAPGASWASPPRPDPRQLDALREAAEPARSHRALPVVAGRVDLDLHLARHEVTLVELTPVVDETPPWWDESRLLGRPRPGHRGATVSDAVGSRREFGDGPLSRAAALVYTLLVVELLLLLARRPDWSRCSLLDRDASNLPLVAVCACRSARRSPPPCTPCTTSAPT